MRYMDNLKQFNIVENIFSNGSWDYTKPNIFLNINNSIETIDIKDNSTLTILEIFNKDMKQNNIKRDINLGENSKLEYIKITKSIEDLEFDYNILNGDNSNTSFHLFEIGDSNIKNSIKSDLKKDQIDIKINGLVKLKDKASSFNSFDINHIHPNTFSDIKMRHLLDGNSKAEFEATTVIGNEALYSKAFQNSKTILLDDNATIKARPHLEILTDELEASHGATTGGIDRDALYYLLSRGLDEKTAYKILIEAFCNSTIEGINNSTIKEWLYEQIRI